MKPDEIKSVSYRQWGAIAFAFLLIPLILILISRDAGWWQAWVYSCLIFLVGFGGRIWAEQRHPGLQAERMKLGKGQEVKKWDRVLSPLMGFCVLYPLHMVAALDHYYSWSAPFPLWVNITGFVLCIVGYNFAQWAFMVNRYFSSMVRIQYERGHEVCTSGPYRYLRHPGYAGHFLPLVGVPLVLDSLWTFIPSLVALLIIITRTALEDRALLNELPGYREYAEGVRYRVVPGIW